MDFIAGLWFGRRAGQGGDGAGSRDGLGYSAGILYPGRFGQIDIGETKQGGEFSFTFTLQKRGVAARLYCGSISISGLRRQVVQVNGGELDFQYGRQHHYPDKL